MMRSRWLDWQPKTRILTDLLQSEPTKPTEPPAELGFVGFVGATLAQFRIIEGGAGPAVAAEEPARISWAEWYASEMNRLFQEHGATGQPGRIRAETVRHGETARRERRQ